MTQLYIALSASLPFSPTIGNKKLFQKKQSATIMTTFRGHPNPHPHQVRQFHRLRHVSLSPRTPSLRTLPATLSAPSPTFRSRFSCGSSSRSRSSSSATTPARTCKNCKKQYDPSLNHPTACRYHTAHFGGETKRKFEGVHSGGTMSTPESGKVFQYWHCCGSEYPFDQGCTAAPHRSYDD